MLVHTESCPGGSDRRGSLRAEELRNHNGAAWEETEPTATRVRPFQASHNERVSLLIADCGAERVLPRLTKGLIAHNSRCIFPFAEVLFNL